MSRKGRDDDGGDDGSQVEWLICRECGDPYRIGEGGGDDDVCFQCENSDDEDLGAR